MGRTINISGLVFYVGFWLLSLYFALLVKDYTQALATMGIGLVFDPFPHELSWAERTRLQKAVPIVHLSIMAALLGWIISA
jgi:hypothetical protein